MPSAVHKRWQEATAICPIRNEEQKQRLIRGEQPRVFVGLILIQESF